MKLWFFRTPNGYYGIVATRRSAKNFDSIYSAGHIDELGLRTRRVPNGYPKLNPGDCIPVELVPVVKGKKARKG